MITERGGAVLADNPSRIDSSILVRFDEFKAFLSRSRASARGTARPLDNEPVAAILEGAGKQAPAERIDFAYEELSAALRSELLDRIRAAPPAFFERLVVDLMLAMGYGPEGQAVGRPNDEGIDGIITQDALGLETVLLQAKRNGPDNTVGIKDIQAFIGALVGRGASKGVFITSSQFSTQAQDFARSATHQKVILIDGDQLTQLMVRYGVGVQTARKIDLKRIDENYFDLAE